MNALNPELHSQNGEPSIATHIPSENSYEKWCRKILCISVNIEKLNNYLGYSSQLQPTTTIRYLFS